MLECIRAQCTKVSRIEETTGTTEEATSSRISSSPSAANQPISQLKTSTKRPNNQCTKSRVETAILNLLCTRREAKIKDSSSKSKPLATRLVQTRATTMSSEVQPQVSKAMASNEKKTSRSRCSRRATSSSPSIKGRINCSNPATTLKPRSTTAQEFPTRAWP